MACPDEQQFADLLEERLEEPARGALHDHVSGCDSCRRLMAVLARTRPVDSATREQVAHYRLEELIGRGGMGMVYRATDLRLRRAVALKVLTPNLAGDAKATARLLREARAAGALDHPNVAQVFDVGQDGEVAYLAFALYEGETLRERLRRGPLSPSEAGQLALQMALGLACAHAAGIVHRDVKPSNVLLTPSGPRLLDFGLAKLDGASIELTDTGQLLGTVAYMAPEQQRGTADARADVWALGVTAYEMLAGKPPFAGATAFEILHAARELEPPPPPGPPALQAIVLKCLDKDPARRFPSGAEVAADLERWLRGERVVARRPGVGARLRRSWKRLRLRAVVGLAALVALGSLGALVKSRLGAHARMERAERLAKSAQRMRSTLRNAYLLPLHDVRADRAAVRTELESIEAEQKRLGPDERGLSEYATGSGLQALGKWAEARPHLEAAWRAGQTQPEAAYALAVDIAYLYGAARGDTERLPPAERPLAHKKLAAEMRDPALGYLRAAAGGGPPGAVEALIAVYEDREEDALRLTREVFERTPSEYEFGELYARTLMYRTMRAWEMGDAAAVKQFDAIEQSIDRVLAVARSDPRMLADAAVRSARMSTSRFLAGAVEPAEIGFKRAIALAEQAIQAAADEVDAYSVQTDALVNWGISRRDSGRDGRATLRQAIDAASRGVKVDGKNWRVRFNLGMAYAQLGQSEDSAGADGRENLARGIQELETSLRQHDYEDTYHQLANAYWSLAQIQGRHGDDPRATYAHAAETLRKTLAIDASTANVHSDLGGILDEAAVWELQHGHDPTTTLDEAQQALENAVRISTRDSGLLGNLSWNLDVRARYDLAIGRDPTAALDRAIEGCERAEALSATDPYAPSSHAIALRLRAIVEQRAGKDPTATLARASARMAVACKNNPTDPGILRPAVQLELQLAELARAHGHTPSLGPARAMLKPLLTRDPGDADSLALDAAVHRLSGRSDDCAAGDASLDRALATNPSSARVHWERALLDDACAPVERDPARRALRQDRAKLERAAAERLEPYIARDPG